MAFTIKHMLQLQPFETSKLTAGESGIDQQIHGVAILEEKDFNQAGMKGNILLVSSFLLTFLTSRNVNFITECSRLGTVGMCIKKSHSEFELSPEYIQSADSLHFPVILVDEDVDSSQIINTITYEIFRIEGFDNHMSFEENFLQALISCSQDRETLLQRSSMIGLRTDEILCAVLIQPTKKNVSQKIQNYCLNEWPTKCYTVTRNFRVLVALAITNTAVNRDNIFSITGDLYNQLKAAIPDTDLSIGIGRCYCELPDFRKSFLDACCALSYSMLSKSNCRISHYNDLGVYRILFDYKNRKELYRLNMETIGVIAEYDNANQTNYLDTLRTYFSEGCSINNTAKKVHVHYNTVLKRLERIHELFGFDINNQQDRVNLYICLIASDSQDLWKIYMQ